jgi:hypothetical protein
MCFTRNPAAALNATHSHEIEQSLEIGENRPGPAAVIS